MKKNILVILCVALAIVGVLSIGVAATGALETISAYLTYNVTVKLDGQTQTMYDANGMRVYPINYQGTTYLPIRAVSNMLGIDVDWDGQTRTVLLGENGTAKDFINEVRPYASKYDNLSSIYVAEDMNWTETIAGKTYNSYIKMATNDVLYYDLGGKYDTISFSVYTEEDLGESKPIIQCVGDNDTVLETVEITPFDAYTKVTVDVSGVLQLKIQSNHPTSDVGRTPIYIYNATIE